MIDSHAAVIIFKNERDREEALETAKSQNWTVVSMKNDWAEIFPAPSS